MIRQKGFREAKAIKKILPLSLFFIYIVTFFLIFSFSASTLYAKETPKGSSDSEILEIERIKQNEEKIEQGKRKKTSKKKKKGKNRRAKKKKGNDKKVYLTFDDGPSKNTDAILKILDKYRVKATFFVIGKEDKASIKRYQEIVNKGHTIALHSYTHNYKEIYKNLTAFKKDFKRIRKLIYKATGIRSNYYRFPGGTSNTVSPTDMNVFVNYFNKKGIRYYDWNIQSGDAIRKPPKPDVIYKNVVDPILQYSLQSYIVLIHDSVPMKNSVKALPMIIERLQEEKCELLPIDDNTEQIHHKVQKRR